MLYRRRADDDLATTYISRFFFRAIARLLTSVRLSVNKQEIDVLMRGRLCCLSSTTGADGDVDVLHSRFECDRLGVTAWFFSHEPNCR